MAESPARNGILLCRAILREERLAILKSAINKRYKELETARKKGDAAAIARLIGERERFVPTASSFTIGAVPEVNVSEILTIVVTGPAEDWIKDFLNDRLICDLDQSWVRRQYAPSRYPALHAPHGWHQDGALKFDFLSHANRELPPDAMLNMVTCWISLDPCGVDAPGLELITERIDRLLLPTELQADSVQARFEPEKFWRPILELGDALLFRGEILHRTHVMPRMSQDRTSIELRFFMKGKIPERIKSDRFIELC